MIKLSIITVNYNNKEGLINTIKSVINQSWNNFEYIIIDGESDDGSVEVINEYNSQITYWISEKDSGIYNAMNKGISNAKGEYILFLNSGDVLNDNQALNNIYEYLYNYDIISFNLRVIGESMDFIKIYPKNISFSYFLQDTLPHPATFIKRTNFDSVGFYDENLKIVSDWKWFIIALFRYNLSHKHHNLVFSKFYLDGISSSINNYEVIKHERHSTLESEFPRFYQEYLNLSDNIWFIEKFNKNIFYKLFKLASKVKHKIKKTIG